MERVNSKSFISRFVLIGFSIGIALIILVIIADSQSAIFPNSLTGYIEAHKKSILIWLIEILPFVLAILGYYIGQRYSNLSEDFVSTIQNQVKASDGLLDFAEKLQSGDVNAFYRIENENDVLGKSLIRLRDNLKKNKEEENSRKREDTQRTWVTEGIAKFGEILRQHNDNLEDLATNIVSNLVKYIEVEQATFFVINNSDPNNQFFEQKACFAYDRKKFSNKSISWGEGLIGACALEKETIFMTNVTEGYVEITSGLGKANPRCILIVPLKSNEEVHGVIELASFKILKKYEIEFVEKIAESIASTIASVKINLQTSRLLKESQEQASKMANQEEILRQNMEELKATQREAAKQSEEFISFTNSVNHTLIRAEYDTKGILLYSNTRFLQKLEYSDSSEVLGHHISMFINEKDKIWFNKIWDNLAHGGRHFEGDMKHVTKYGNDLWTMATYVCVRNNEGGVEKILFLGTDITENKKQSLDYEGQIRALNRSTLKADYEPNGSIIECNDKFGNALGYKLSDMKGKHVFDFVPKDDQKQFAITWDNVNNRIPFDGRLKFITADKKTKWFHGTYTAVNNMYGEVAKIVFIANDITEQINMENKAKQQTEQLKEQEKKLQKSQEDLSLKLRDAREEMKTQFREIETVKVLNEKTLEGTLDAIVTINQKGVVEFFNKAAEELWEVSKEEILGQEIIKILPEDYSEKGDNYMGNYFKYSKKPLLRQRIEVFIISRNGEKVPVLITLSEARMGFRYSLTAFIQNIEVELF
jgi:PAS domain S-box-containing protein